MWIKYVLIDLSIDKYVVFAYKWLIDSLQSTMT